jgi:glycosyltransferase involved in cell wall biosynthesis
MAYSGVVSTFVRHVTGFVAAMKPLTLSVVMPNYNHARYLAEAIEGIAAQSRPPDEFLILDDGSTDNSLEVIAPYLKRFPFLRLIRHQQNRGVIAAHERLFAEARGDLLFATAADDVRLPGFFARAVPLAERYPQAGLVFGAVGLIDEAGRRLGRIDVRRWTESLYADPQRFLREYLMVELPAHSPCSGTIYRRETLREVGGYRPELGSWSDTFAFRAIGLKYGVCYLADEVAQFRRLLGSFSQQSTAQPRKLLDILARAEYWMRADEFRERFPEDYVRRWRRACQRQVLWDYVLGSDSRIHSSRSFWGRNLRRLPRACRALLLLSYRGDLRGCTESAATKTPP